MDAIIFARVSTEEQKREGYSIPAQIAKMQDYCQRKGFKVIDEYQIDESSTTDEREKLSIVIEEIKTFKGRVALIVETVDRLQRSFKESVIFDELRKQDKVEIHFLREGLIVSKESASSDLLRWDMGVMFSRSYVLQLSDNVKRSILQKAKMGEYPFKAPYGYQNITLTNGKKDIQIESYQSQIVKKVFELYVSGAFSMGTLRAKLKADYNLSWSQGFLDKVLKNPFYYGIMTINGKSYSHKYQPIVTKELFEKVQKVKAGHFKKPFKYKGLNYAYRGLIRCSHCGLAITPEKHKGHIYYHCTEYNGKHGAKWIREEEITNQLADLFKSLQIPQPIVEQITESLKNVHEGKSIFRTERQNALRKERDVYAKRTDKIYMDHLDGRITEDQYDKYYNQFRNQIADIDAQLELLQDAEDNYYFTAKYVLELANKAHDLFLSSEVEEKRQILKLVLSNLELEGKNLKFSLVKPFDTILNFADRQQWLPVLNTIRTECYQDVITLGERFKHKKLFPL